MTSSEEGLGSHHIPAFLLRRFSYDDPRTQSKRLWVYEKGRQPNPNGSPKGEGKIYGYFRIENEEFESPAHDIIPSLDSPYAVITFRQKRILARYYAMLFARTQARKRAVKYVGASMQVELTNAINNPARVYRCKRMLENDIGEWISMYELMRILEKNIEDCTAEQSNQKNFVNNLLGFVGKIEEDLLKLRWSILRAPPDAEFVLSDTPTITRRRLDSGTFGYGWGFGVAGTEALLAISPKSYLCIGHQTHDQIDLGDTAVDELNLHAIRFCVRRAYASRYIAKIEQWMQTESNSLRIGENTFVTRKSIRDLSGGTWLGYLLK
jgi:hypothetical protein